MLSRLLCTAGILASATSFSPPATAQPSPHGRVEAPLRVVFTQTPAAGGPSRIVLYAPRQPLRILSSGFHSAADPSVSWDATRILFAARRTASSPWQIYEMNPDGTGVRQIAKTPFDCRTPIYQSKIFYLDDKESTPQVTFAGFTGEREETSGAPSASLFSVRLDGSGLRRLTYNPSRDYDPVMNEDGRILYASRQRRGVGLFGINLDGTDVAVFSMDEGRPVKRMPAVLASRQVVFVEPEGDAEAGSLASVSLRRNLHSYRRLTRNDAGLFHSPSPLGQEAILAAWRPLDGSAPFGIYHLDLRSLKPVKLYFDAAWNSTQPRFLAPTPMPPGRSSVVEEHEAWARLYCLNVRTTDRPDLAANARRVRILEGVPRTAESEPSPTLLKRVLGEFDLEPDGSFQVRVPPNIPIQIQTLDAQGRALRTSAWIWAKNKQNRGCIGCHEDGELTPENIFASALDKPAAPADPPVAERRQVVYETAAGPVFKTRCSVNTCHPSAARVQFDYQTLIRSGLVVPGSARSSSLMLAHGELAQPLNEAERKILTEWIDLGAHR